MKLSKSNIFGFRLLRNSASFATFSICFTLTARADYASEIMTDGPLAYYRFSDGVTTEPFDIAANQGSLGTAGQGAYSSTIIRPVAGALVGSSNTAGSVTSNGCTIPYTAALNNTGSFTAEAWLKPTSGDTPAFTCPMSSMHVPGPRAGWIIYQGSAAEGWVFRTYNQNGTTAAVNINSNDGVDSGLTAGAWHHLVVTWDDEAKVGRIYVNGALRKTSGITTYVPNGDSNFTMGSRSDNAFNWAGSIDEPAYYDYALDATQIAAHYANGIDPAPATPYNDLVTTTDGAVGYWRFDEAALVNPVAANAGSLGVSGDGKYFNGAKNTNTGPSSSIGFFGFGAGNSALALANGNGNVGTQVSIFNGLTNFSMTGWAKRGAIHSPGTSGMFGQNDVVEFGETGTNLGGWLNPGGTITTPYATPDNAWAFVCLTGDGTTARLYVDGAQVSQLNCGTLATSTYKFNIGGGGIWNVSGDFFRGEIDEVAVFNTTLSGARISQLYDVALSTPQLLWTAANGTSPTLWDIGATNNWMPNPTGAAIPYSDYSGVTFDQTAGGTGVVDITTNVNPMGVTFNGTKDYTIMSTGGFGMLGSKGLTKNGSCTVELSSVNAYSGATTLNEGILKAGSATAFGSGRLVFGPSCTGKVQLNGNSLSMGGLDTNAVPGTPIVESGSATAGTDTLALTSAITNTFSGTLQDGGVRALALTKSGTGTLLLTGTNTYSGATTINAGTLQIGDNTATGSLGSGAVANSGTLAFKRTSDYTSSSNITGTGNISMRTGNVTLSGSVTCNNINFVGGYSRTLTLSGSSPNVITSFTSNQDGHGTLLLAKTPGVDAISGIVKVGDGYASQVAVRLGNNEQIADSTSVEMYGSNGGHGGRAWFQLMGYSETIAGLTAGQSTSYVQNGGVNNSVLTLAGAGTYNLANGSIQNSASGTLALNKTGTGTQTLTGGGLSYTGPTTLTAGILNLAGGDSGGFNSPIIFNGGTLGHIGTGWRTVGAIATVAANSTLNVTNNGTNNQLFFDAGLAGSANLVITNTGTATTGVNFRNAAGSYSGAMTFNGGQLGISSGAGLVLANADLTLAGASVNLTAIFACTATNASIKSLNGDAASSAVLGGQTLTLGTNNGTGSFAGAIGSTGGGLIKTGTGTQTLSGAVTYTGATTVNGGILNLDYTDGTQKLSDTAALTLAGGAIRLSGGSLTEVVASTTLAGGASAVIRNGGTSVLQMGAITANTGATINFSAESIATTTSGTAGLPLGSWATVVTPGGTRFATKDGSDFIIGLAGTAATTVNDFVDNAVNYDYALSGGTDTQTDHRTANAVTYLGSGEIVDTAGFDLTIKALINGGTGPLTISGTGWLVASDLLLSAMSSGISVTAPITGTNLTTSGNVTLSGVNDYTGTTSVISGTLLVGADTALGTNPAVVVNGGALDINGLEMTFGSLAGTGGTVTNNAANVTLTVGTTTTANFSGAIQNGTGSVTLTKINDGTQILSGTNTYTGTTTISGGILQIGDANFPYVVYPPPSVTGGANGTLGSGDVVNNGILIFARTSDQNIPNAISGSGPIYVRSSATTTFSGSSTVAGSVMYIRNNYGAGNTVVFNKTPGSNAITTPSVYVGGERPGIYGNNTTLNLAASEQIADTSVVTLEGGHHGAPAVFNLMGNSETIAGLIGASAGTGAAYVRNLAAGGPSTLTINTATGTTYNYPQSGAGVMNDGAGGKFNLVKSGEGTQSLGGNNIDYTGTTTVNNGRLLLNNNDDAWTSKITIATGAVVEVYRDNGADYEHRNAFTLDGAGTLEKTGNGLMDMSWDQGGTVAMASGGHIHIKEGTLRLGYGAMCNWTTNKADLTLETGTTFDFWDNNLTTSGVVVDALNGGGNIVRSNYAQTGNLTVGVDGGSGSFSGVISNASGIINLIKEGTGTQALTGTNTYTGDTTVNGGVLAVDGDAIADTNKLVINGGKVAATGTEVVAVLDLGSGPVPDGTYGATESGATYIDDTHFTGTAGKVRVGAGVTFESWMDTFTFAPGADKTPTGDPDNDGLENAVEMVLGGNPATGMDTALMPTIELVTDPIGVPAGNYLLFTYRRADQAVDAGLTIGCEYDTDLTGTWTLAEAPAATILTDDNYAWTNPAATDTDRVRVFVPRGANVKLFGRLNVKVP